MRQTSGAPFVEARSAVQFSCCRLAAGPFRSPSGEGRGPNGPAEHREPSKHFSRHPQRTHRDSHMRTFQIGLSLTLQAADHSSSLCCLAGWIEALACCSSAWSGGCPLESSNLTQVIRQTGCFVALIDHQGAWRRLHERGRTSGSTNISAPFVWYALIGKLFPM